MKKISLFFMALVWVLSNTQGAVLPVDNASFELPGTVKQTNWAAVPSWSSDSTAVDSGVETGQGATDGIWSGFLWADDSSVWNLTTNIVEAGESYRVQVDAKSTGGAGTLRVRLFYVQGSRQTLAVMDASLSSGMTTYVVQFNADDMPGTIGQQIGIELENVGSGWLAIDHVRLSTFDPNQVWEGGFGSIDVRYLKDAFPGVDATTNWSEAAWRGERVYAQAVVWAQQAVTNVVFSVTEFSDGVGNMIPTVNVRPQFVSYVLTDDGSAGCGNPSASPVLLMPDILDTDTQRTLAAGTAQPIWISIDVPAGTEPGTYQGQLSVSSTGNDPIVLTMEVKVLANILPPPEEWNFHLDLWQNPWSVARYHNVVPWSQDHIDRLVPLLTLLKDAGQKVITTTLVNAPWGGQTYDAYGTMIEWTKHTNGSWSYDYTLFDQYVELCDSIGITAQINCYSMAAWGNIYQYYDEASASYQKVTASPGTPAYTAHWTPFLQDFSAHLQSKGWTARTKIAMDERAVGEMQAVVNLVKTHAPGLGISLAGHYFAALDADIDDWCPWAPDVTPAATAGRAARGQITTFYTMCGSKANGPNNFPFSPPAEQAWDGWFAAAKGLNGYLRWAYCSWVEDPLVDARHSAFQGGDCFQVYPGARSSIRFEQLRDGIEDYEKIAILKRQLSAENVELLNDTLSTINYPQPNCTQVIQDARAVLDALSRTVDATDVTPPSPDPLTWAVPPTATRGLSVSMTATTASDANNVQYYFTCISGGGNDSGWQDSPVYEDTGLLPATTYAYTVKARDVSLAQNMTAASNAASTTTGPAILSGLVAHYTMDAVDRNGSSLVDVSGAPHYNGTIVDAVASVDGLLAEALAFNADGQYIAIGAPSIPVPWTVSVWVRPTGTESAATLLNSSATSLRLQQWNGTGKVGLTQYGMGDYTFDYSAPLNAWVHLVFRGTAAGTDLWVNGKLVDSLPQSIVCPLDTVGRAEGDLRAHLDDLVVWRRALSAAEIASVHASGVAGKSFGQENAVRILSMGWESEVSAWRVGFSSLSNRSYAVEYCNELASGLWQELMPTFSGDGMEMCFSDPTTNLQRFYRLRIDLP